MLTLAGFFLGKRSPQFFNFIICVEMYNGYVDVLGGPELSFRTQLYRDRELILVISVYLENQIPGMNIQLPAYQASKQCTFYPLSYIYSLHLILQSLVFEIVSFGSPVTWYATRLVSAHRKPWPASASQCWKYPAPPSLASPLLSPLAPWQSISLSEV